MTSTVQNIERYIGALVGNSSDTNCRNPITSSLVSGGGGKGIIGFGVASSTSIFELLSLELSTSEELDFLSSRFFGAPRYPLQLEAPQRHICM